MFYFFEHPLQLFALMIIIIIIIAYWLLVLPLKHSCLHLFMHWSFQEGTECGFAQITLSHASAHESPLDMPQTVTHACSVGSFDKPPKRFNNRSLAQTRSQVNELSSFVTVAKRVPPSFLLLSLFLFFLFISSALLLVSVLFFFSFWMIKSAVADAQGAPMSNGFNIIAVKMRALKKFLWAREFVSDNNYVVYTY